MVPLSFRWLAVLLVLVLPAEANACEWWAVGSHNDALGFGWGPADDNFRSFGFDATVSCGRFGVDLDYSGFTNRSHEAPEIGSRVDELLFLASWEAFGNARVSFAPVLGLAASGDLGGAEIQNAMHRATGHPQVFLPYDEPRRAPLVGARARVGIVDSPIRRLDLFTSSWVAPGYGSSAEGGLRLHVGSPSFRVAPSVALRGSERRDAPAQDPAMERESGFILALEQQFSFLYFRWEASPGTRHSTGTVLIVVTAADDPRPFDHEDAGADFGVMALPAEGYFTTYRLPLTRRLHLTASGFWGPYVADRVPAFPDVRAHFQQLELGPQLQLLEPRRTLQINPFARATVGIRREVVVGAQRTFERVDAASPAAALEAGVRLSTPLSFADRNILYGFVGFYRYSLTRKTEVDVFDHPQRLNVPGHQLGVGVTFVADLH